MRLLVTGAGLAVILLIVGACKSSKQASSQQTEELSRYEEQAIQAGISRRLETDYLGDTLRGRMPLPYTVPRSASYQIQADGITLDLTLSDSTISYTAIAKPVARSTLIQEDSSSVSSRSSEDYLLRENESKTKKKTGLPWWIWPVLIVVLILIVLGFLRKIKIPF